MQHSFALCIDLSVEKGFRCGQVEEHVCVSFQSALLLLLSQFTILRGTQGPEPFQVTFLIYCHLLIIPAPPLSFTLRYLLLLLLLPATAKRKKQKSKAPLLPGAFSSTLHLERLPFTSLNCFISCCQLRLQSFW